MSIRTTVLYHTKSGTLAEWTALNPIIPLDELVAETGGDAVKLKLGNGVDHYLDLAYISGSGSSGGLVDLLYVPGTGQTTVDEFNDGDLDPAWTRVDPGGAGRLMWTEEGDCISAALAGGDASQELHALVRPVSAPLAIGDGYITRMSVLKASTADFLMAGIVLADGNTAGAGTQVAAIPYGWPGSWVSIARLHNYSVQDDFNQGGSPYLNNTTWMRLARIADSGGTKQWRLDLSPNGINWLPGPNIVFNITPTHVGLQASSWGTATKSVVSFEMLRRVSGVA